MSLFIEFIVSCTLIGYMRLFPEVILASDPIWILPEKEAIEKAEK